MSGDLTYNPEIENFPGEVFGHLALDCASGNIIGTFANIDEELKRLAILNRVNGMLSHIPGNIGWNSGFHKPSNTGSCIDQVNGVYYYIGTEPILNGVDIESGNLIFSDTEIPALFFIQHSSGCDCSVNVEDYSSEWRSVIIGRNPFHTFLEISNSSKLAKQISLYDLRGRCVLSVTITAPALIYNTFGCR